MAKSEPEWLKAITRDPVVGVKVGTRCLIRKATEVKHTSIGPTWWLFDGHHLRHFAEELGGHDLYRLVEVKGVFSDQQKMRQRVAPFIQSYWKHRLQSQLAELEDNSERKHKRRRPDTWVRGQQ